MAVDRSPPSLPRGFRNNDGAKRMVGETQLSLLELLTASIKRWRALVLVPVVTALLLVGALSFAQRDYQASSTFMPVTATVGSGQLGGLVGRLGLNLSGGGEKPLEFYGAIVTSQELLIDAAGAHYEAVVDGDTVRGSLADIYGIDGDSERARAIAAAGVLKHAVSSEVNLRTGLVAVRTQAATRDLAVQLNETILELVNQFNVEKQQSQASAQRQFIEQRLTDAQRDLEAAEERLQRFLERNRRYEDSPALRFEAARLQRRVDQRQQVVISLAEAHEQAGIDEMRSTPVITVVETPASSVRRAGAPPVLTGFIGLVLGGMLAMLYVFLVTHLERLPRETAEEVDELRRLWARVRRMFSRTK